MVDLNEAYLVLPVDWYRLYDANGKTWTTLSIRVILEDLKRVYIDVTVDLAKNQKKLERIQAHLDKKTHEFTPFLGLRCIIANKKSQDGTTRTSVKTSINNIDIIETEPKSFVDKQNIVILSGKVHQVKNDLMILTSSYRDIKNNKYLNRYITIGSKGVADQISQNDRIYCLGRVSTATNNGKDTLFIRVNPEHLRRVI